MTLIKSTVDDQNISVTLYASLESAKPFAVVMRDEDANALIPRYDCPSREVAEAKFGKLAGQAVPRRWRRNLEVRDETEEDCSA
jgi:hypothetical protein